MLKLHDQTVAIGSTVTVQDVASGEVECYTLVPPSQADIACNRIASVTPLAHALYGRRAGDAVDVAAPSGTIRLLIQSVQAVDAGSGYG